MIDENKPFSHSADSYGSKANFDVNEKKLILKVFLVFFVKLQICLF